MSAPPSGPQAGIFQELPALTGLRGFAALWVLLFHIWAMSGGPALKIPGLESVQGSSLFSVGWAGVDLFFCLSAFLLVLPYARWRYQGAARPDTGRYLLRRALRIYPAYLFQLLIILGLAVIVSGQPLPTLHELVAHLLLWFNVGWNWVSPRVGVWFTLPIEFSFYLLLPFLAPLIDRRRWPWLLCGAIAVTVGFRYAMHLVYSDEPVPVRVIVIERLPGRIDQFVIGMLAGASLVAAHLRGWRPARLNLWFVGGLLGLILCCTAIIHVADRYWFGHWLLFSWHTVFSACLVPILLASAWQAPLAMVLLANRALRYLGKVSFALYLWHMPILLWILPWIPAEWSPEEKMLALLVSVLPASLLVAELSWRWIELPFLERKPKHRQLRIKGG